LVEPAAQGRRPQEKGANDRTASERGTPAAPLLAAARAALESGSQNDTGSAASAAVQALSARTPVALPTSAALAPASEPQPEPPASTPAPAPSAPAATSQPAPVATAFPVSATPAAPAPSAGKAPLGEQLASLAPPPRPQSAPVQLRQRKHNPPEFPVRAVRAKVFEGHVLARVWVNADGSVEQVDIVKATPPRVFDDEVKRALTAWTFDPPGRPVDTTIELDFKP
jgi:protein TonB